MAFIILLKDLLKVDNYNQYAFLVFEFSKEIHAFMFNDYQNDKKS